MSNSEGQPEFTTAEKPGDDDVEGQAMARAAGDDDDTEGHLRTFKAGEGHVMRSDEDDTEGHLAARAAGDDDAEGSPEFRA
ncbi:MAG: hypothetical protein M3492_02780 [Actinomycetota bacterium]|nr:hypothetical protein [Actinomycetota bacterium]